MPNVPHRLSRRTALRTAAVAAGLAATAAIPGCDDAEPGGAGTPGTSAGATQPPEPSTDPAVVAALTTAATQIAQLALRISTAGQTFPALRGRLATAVQSHAAHVAKLKELGDFEPPQPGKLPPLPKKADAVLTDLVGREQKLSVAHATAAGKLTGEAARVLAMIAASESQFAATLTPLNRPSA